MTIINVMVDDQRLEFSSMPVVASEGVKETYVKFALSSDWSGFGATALFYRDDSPEDVYTSVLDGAGLAEVPYEITAAPGWIRFGLSGSDGTSVHTSEILKYKIVKGKYTSGQSSEPPAPGIYEQMLAIAGQMRDTLNAAVIEQNAIIQGLVTDMTDLRSDMETEQTTFESVVTGQINTLVNNFAGSSRETVLYSGSHQVNVGNEIDLVSSPTVYDYLDIVLNDGLIGTIIGPTQNSHWRVTGETIKSTGASVTTYVVEGVLDGNTLRVTESAAIVDTGTASTRYDLEDGPLADESLRRYCLKVIGRKLTDDAEVLNIRVGADGVTYQTAGTAVRSQLDKKLNAPISGGTVDYGTPGQLLATDGQGNTEWVDSVISDGSITLAKLAPGVIDTTYQIQGAAAESVTVGQSLASKANAADVTTLEGSIEAIEDDVDGRLNDIKSSLQQDVYNFINYPSSQVTDEGITFTPNGDEIVISGTATGNAWLRLYNRAEFPFGIENGKQYYIAVNQDDTEEYGLYLRIYYYMSGDTDAHLIADMNSGYFTFPHDAIGYALTLVVPKGVTLNNVTVRPILCELGNIKKILDNATRGTKSNLYTNLRYQTVTSNGITFTTNGNSIVLNGTSGDGHPRFTLCDSHYGLLYGLVSGKSYWFDVGLKDKTKVNYVYINLSFYLSDGTNTTEVGIKGPTKITVPANAVGFYMVLMTQRKGVVIADNTVVSPGIYMVNPMAESRILEQAVSASENVISINGNYASYKDFDLYGVFLNRVTGIDELKSTWRSGYIPIPFAGKYQIFQNHGMFGNTYLNVPLYDKDKRFIKSVTGVDSAFRNIIEVTISESDLYDDMVYYIGLSYEPSTENPDGIPMFMYNADYPSDQRFIEPNYSVYKPYQPPMISIIDDDGASDFLTKLLPIIESKNIPIASAVVTSFADNEQNGFMTWDEIVDANNRGAEFISHSDTHLFSPASIEDAQMNYLRSFNKLRAHGVINDRNILVYAGASAGRRNALVGARRIADGAIDSSGNSMNYRGSIDAWNIKRYRIDADYQYDLDSMKELIDDCKSNGGWMIWMIHCSASEWDEYNAGTSLPQAIDYAIRRGVQIATINHAFKTYVC